MAPRPQQKPQPEPGQPGLKVVEKPAGASASGAKSNPGAGSDQAAANQSREAEAAARRRLHPPRVWPD